MTLRNKTVFDDHKEFHVIPLAVTRREAAKMLGLSEKTIFNLTNSGELTCVKIGRSVRYPVQALHDFIKRNEVGEQS